MPGSFVAASSQKVNLGSYQSFLQDSDGSTMMAWINAVDDSPPSGSYHIGAVSVATGTATITNVSGNGTTVTYTASNTYAVGNIVSITQVVPSAYNLTAVRIASRTGSQFTVTNAATGAFVSGGTAYLDVASPVPSAAIDNVNANGSTIQYTCVNSFSVGNIVTIQDVIPNQFNLSNVPIIAATGTQFTVTSNATGSYVNPSGFAYLVPGAPTTLSSRISLEIQNGGVINFIGRASDTDSEHDCTTGSGLITAGTWQHLCGVNDYVAQTQTIYIDGVQVFQSTGVAFSGMATGAPPSRNSHIGAQDDGTQSFFDGQIHDFRVFSRALSADEIMTIYNALGTDNIYYKLDCRYLLSEATVGATIGTGGANQVIITNITTSNDLITFTAANTFNPGDKITITGVNPSVYNLIGVSVATSTPTQFTVVSTENDNYNSGGTARTINSIPNLGNVNTEALAINGPTHSIGVLRIP